MARMPASVGSSRVATNATRRRNADSPSSSSSPSRAGTTMSAPAMSTNEVNLLVYAYLAESSLDHSAFTLYSESRLAEYHDAASSDSRSAPTLPPTGHLIRILQKGLLYLQAEAKYRGEDVASNPPRLVGYTIPDALPLPALPKSLPPREPSPRASSPPVFLNGKKSNGASGTAGPSSSSGSKRKEQQQDAGETHGKPVLSNAAKKQKVGEVAQGSETNGSGETTQAAKSNKKGKGRALDDQPDSEMSEAPPVPTAANDTTANPSSASSTQASKAAAIAVATSEALSAAFLAKPDNPSSVRRSTSPVVSTRQMGSKASKTRPRSSSPSTSLRPPSSKTSGTRPESTPTLDLTPSAAAAEKPSTSRPSSSTALPSFQRVMSASKMDRPEPQHILEKDAVIQLKGHTAPVTPCHWNPKVPTMLATGAGDSTSRFWDVPSSKLSENPIEPITCKHSSGQRRSDVTAVEWNHDGTLLATGSEDGVARIWAPSGELHLVLPMHQRTIFCVKWNRRGTMLLTGSLDHSVCLWELSFGKVKQQWTCHTESIMDLDWLSDDIFASCSQDKNINIHQIGRSSPAYRFKGHADEVNCIRFDPGGKFLASCSDDQEVRVWSLRPVKSTLGIKDDVKDEGAEEGEISNEDGSGSTKANKDGPLSTSPFRDGEKPCMVLKGHKKEVHAVAWCPKKEASGDNRLLASASFDHTARIWDVTTGACLHIINRHTDMVYSLAWQPEIGEYLATGSNDSTVCITRVKDKQLVHEYTHPGSVFEICWHPTRNQIAVCGKPSSVNVVQFELPPP